LNDKTKVELKKLVDKRDALRSDLQRIDRQRDTFANDINIIENQIAELSSPFVAGDRLADEEGNVCRVYRVRPPIFWSEGGTVRLLVHMERADGSPAVRMTQIEGRRLACWRKIAEGEKPARLPSKKKVAGALRRAKIKLNDSSLYFGGVALRLRQTKNEAMRSEGVKVVLEVVWVAGRGSLKQQCDEWPQLVTSIKEALKKFRVYHDTNSDRLFILPQ
jgi:hypothetical protein